MAARVRQESVRSSCPHACKLARCRGRPSLGLPSLPVLLFPHHPSTVHPPACRQKRLLLNSVSGSASPGRLTAIMGPSGSVGGATWRCCERPLVLLPCRSWQQLHVCIPVAVLVL